jgi:hypothetical protein
MTPTEEDIRSKARIGLTIEQIADLYSIDRKELRALFSEQSRLERAYWQGCAQLAADILAQQIEVAMDGDHKDQWRALETLGKVLLGQSATVTVGGNRPAWEDFANYEVVRKGSE